MNRKGNITLAVIFVVLIAFIGVTMLGFSGIHGKIAAARSRKILALAQIERDLIRCLHNFRADVLALQPLPGTPLEREYFNEERFAQRQVGETRIAHRFSHYRVDMGNYHRIEIRDRVSARRSPYGMAAEAHIRVYSGQIPLSLLPLTVEAPGGTDIARFLVENKITVKGAHTPPAVEPGVKRDTAGFVKKALGLAPDIVLTWAEIRKKFGFEASDKPIPDGIHLLYGEETVDTVFIQGDLERIVFSAREEGRQQILLVKDKVEYPILYTPGENDFQCRDQSVPRDLRFKETLVVNGSVYSLEQAGDAAFLENSNIKLQVSQLVVVTTDLVTRGMDLKRIRLSNLALLNGSLGLPGGRDGSVGVEVAVSGKVRIGADIVTDGHFTNRKGDLTLVGGLHAKEIDNRGRITIDRSRSGAGLGEYFRTPERTHVGAFSIDCIEEVYQ